MTMTLDAPRRAAPVAPCVPQMSPERFRLAAGRVKFAAATEAEGRARFGRADGVWAIPMGEETLVIATDGVSMALERVAGSVPGAAPRGVFYPLASLLASGRKATKGWPKAADDAAPLIDRVMDVAHEVETANGPALTLDRDDALTAFKLAKATTCDRAEYRVIGDTLDVTGAKSPDGVTLAWATWATVERAAPAANGDGWPVVSAANPRLMLEALRAAERGAVTLTAIAPEESDPMRPVAMFAFRSGAFVAAVSAMKLSTD